MSIDLLTFYSRHCSFCSYLKKTCLIFVYVGFFTQGRYHDMYIEHYAATYCCLFPDQPKPKQQKQFKKS